jgi:hypothetical protein
MSECPICNETLNSKVEKTEGPTASYDCPRCGKFILFGTMVDSIGNTWFDLYRRSVLSHKLRCRQRVGESPITIVEAELKDWRLDDPLPSPAEQADRLIQWIGEHQGPPGEHIQLPVSEVSAWIGATISKDFNKGLDWILRQDEVKRLLDFAGRARGMYDLLWLTMAGWERYEAIKRAQVESRRVLMAMKFHDDELNRVVNDYFKPAVARAEFELRLLTDGQPAGLIDDQLRVALRTSRFVIADLTHGSKGAYWEAGFAEGLGLPVIYTCRKKEWTAQKSHFDTNHLVTIVWDPENLDDAAKNLTATIRATLPGEAKMTD